MRHRARLWGIAATLALVGCTEQQRSITGQHSITGPRAALHQYTPALVPAPGREQAAEKLMLQMAREFPGFGGWYIDNGRNLVVYITDLSQAAPVRARVWSVFEADLTRHVTPKFFSVTVRLGRYDFRELAAWRDIVSDGLLGKMPGVHLVDADEALNRVTIGIDSIGVPGIRENVVRRLVGLGVPQDALNFVESAGIVLNRGTSSVASRKFGPANSTLLDQPVPLVGGYVAHTDNWICTFGITLTRNNVKSVATVSHCTTQEDALDFGLSSIRVSINNESSWAIIGHEYVDPGPTCGTNPPCRQSDVALYTVADTVAFRQGAIAATTGTVPSTWGQIGPKTVDQSFALVRG